MGLFVHTGGAHRLILENVARSRKKKKTLALQSLRSSVVRHSEVSGQPRRKEGKEQRHFTGNYFKYSAFAPHLALDFGL